MKQDAYDVLYGTVSPNLVTVRTRPCRHCGAAKPENEWCNCEVAQRLMREHDKRECESSYESPAAVSLGSVAWRTWLWACLLLAVIVAVALLAANLTACSDAQGFRAPPSAGPAPAPAVRPVKPRSAVVA